MTVAATVRKAGPTPGNSLATVFPFAFKVFVATDIQVILTVIATGAQTVLVLNDPLGYTVALNPDQNANPGGSITYNPLGVPLPVTQSLTIVSVVPQVQGTHIINGGAFFANNVEDMGDKAVINVQDLNDKVGSSVRFPSVDSAALNAILPAAAARANTTLGFDAAGNVLVGAVTGSIISAAWLAVVQSATLALGRAAMGVNAFADAILTGATTIGQNVCTAASKTVALAYLAGEAISLGGVISPAQIVAAQADYNPPNLATATRLRLNSDARRNISGLAGGNDGRILTITNVGSFPITFTYDDAASTAANRFRFACTLGGDQSITLIYDGTTARWRAVTIPEAIGTIKDFGGGTVPQGFAACDGSALSRATFAFLFNEIGTTWGVGDGVTTFNMPDFRRRTAVGSGGAGTGTLGNAAGNTGGEEAHSLSAAEGPAHTHVSNDTVTDPTGGTVDFGGADTGRISAATGGYSTGSSGSGTAHNNIQPSAVVTKIIRTF